MHPIDVICCSYQYLSFISFFFCNRDSKGLKQGRPLSPFLFLLLAEALNKLIHHSRGTGELEGVRTSDIDLITYVPFLDDVLMLEEGTT